MLWSILIYAPVAHWVFAGTGLSDAEAWLAASLEPAPGTEGEPTHG